MPSTLHGRLEKMSAQHPVDSGDAVRYTLRLFGADGERTLALNPLIGQEVSISFVGLITCRVCGTRTRKSYAQGYCYPCMRDAPEASECVLRPERCQAHLNGGRDPAWERTHHLQPHCVYLALSSAVKVGVTRRDQVPTRWIDQGASRALIIAETPHRALAGYIEVALKTLYTDKTAWQRMLKGEIAEDADLLAERARALDYLKTCEDPTGERASLADYVTQDHSALEIAYPVTAHPLKVKSVTLDKSPTVSGTLEGIKGQYLILNEGAVINLRRHTSYHIRFGVI